MVLLVNKMTVTGDPAEFLRITEALTDFMRRQPGYIRYQLLHSLRNENVYVEIALWDKAESHLSAVQSDGFRERVSGLGAVATVDPDVYEVIREGETILA
ncbi:antibiotic biosynthesis monooxygenase family protein [Nonomuraea sp. NPDC049158]|uniref:antibiotic biosynthesis monooxygenase family protein n=1 Tax=Nonomuraea sp. NPDC049158 TaxID=3155649 RepID=UPI0033CA9C45